MVKRAGTVRNRTTGRLGPVAQSDVLGNAEQLVPCSRALTPFLPAFSCPQGVSGGHRSRPPAERLPEQALLEIPTLSRETACEQLRPLQGQPSPSQLLYPAALSPNVAPKPREARTTLRFRASTLAAQGLLEEHRAALGPQSMRPGPCSPRRLL